MMTNYTEEFSKMTKEDWLERIHREGLRDDALLAELDKNLVLNPFYLREDSVETLKALDNKFNQKYPRGSFRPRDWDNLAYITVSSAQEANLRILEALNGGADSLYLEISGRVDWGLLFYRSEDPL